MGNDAAMLTDAHRGSADLRSAPSLPWEVGNALTALFKRGRIDLRQAQKALESFEAIPIHLAEVDRGQCEIARRLGIEVLEAES